MILSIKVIPNSSKNSIESFQDGILKIKIKAIAEKGKANEELIRFLSKTLDLSKADIVILSGHTSRLKKVEIKKLNDIEDLKNSIQN